MVFACKEDVSPHDKPREQAASAGMTPASVGGGRHSVPDDATARAAHIRSRIEKFKEWGGHSPVPSRIINANTFAKVRPEVSASDIPALMLLVHDPASEMRDMAGMLLGCVDPHAEPALQAMLEHETDNARRRNLMDARDEARFAATSETLCK